MARTSDWVDEQSTQDSKMVPEAVAHSAQPVTPPPRDKSCKDRNSDVKPHRADVPTSQSRSSLVYSISTLLKLRHGQGAVPVMLRVKPEAIAENIFQYMGAASTRRLPSRSRGLSDISNLSRGSFASQNIDTRPSIESKFMNIPRLNRQAPPPIGIPPPLQRHDGFVRFLQQHASPPHHRVTAGGRIVPAGPTSPPPMLDFASLNGLVRDRLGNADVAQKDGRSMLSALKHQGTQAQGVPSMTAGNLGGYSSNQGGSFACQPNFTQSSLQTAPYNVAQYGYQSLSAPTLQPPPSMVPVAVFPDGSTLVSCNGMHYRTYWNGITTIMEPMQFLQQPPDQQNYPGFQQTHLDTAQSGFNSQPAKTLIAPGPLASITNGSRASSNREASDSSHAAHTGSKEAAFKAELTKLDKHMALYHFEIAPEERTEMVAQRRYLVEALDKIRVGREKDSRSIPIIAPQTGLPITPPTKAQNEQQGGVRGANFQKKSTRKTLSPAALPFVPRSALNTTYGPTEKRTFSDQSTQYGDSILSKRPTHNESSLNVKDMVNAAIARKAQNTYDLSGSTQVTSHRQGSSSSVLDPSDPAMRVVDYNDIEYASRYLYNWGLEKKTYCTTAAEFQEAIRRVRDQARRYGCFGGSSKDPAYDAEQDIWWAICDRDPIPLPAEVPDHVANPRPWDWEDSAFNFRRKDAPLPPLTIDNARNSPRLSGWDPITTESMRDRMDVTRSYYAYKGQLPNTPFRTWAYDDAGNKMEIQNPHFLDHSRFHSRENAAKSVSHRSQPAPKAKPHPDASAVAGQHLEPNSFKTLRSLNSNEVNSRRIPIRKDGRKLNKTDGDAVPLPVPSKLEPAVTSSGQNAAQHVMKVCSPDPNNPLANNTVPSSAVTVSRQPYVEECPETPATRHRGPSVKWGPSPLRTPKSSPAKSSLGSQSNGRPTPMEIGSNEAVTELSSTYFTPDPDSAMDPVWGGQYPIYDKRNPRFFDLPTAVLSANGPSELSAETRSPWGPDEDSGSSPYSPKLIASLKSHNLEKTAKVNIPVGAHDCVPIGGRYTTSEVKSTHVPSLVPTSNGFLRKMLKSPTYSSFPVSKPTTGTSLGLADRLSKLLRGGGDNAPRAISKENVFSAEKAKENSIKGASKDGDQSDTASLFKSETDASISKAPSSLASSTYQAHGYLPQFDGAGKNHAATLPQHEGNEISTRQVRVNLPQCSSYGGSSATLTPSSCQVHNELNARNPKAGHQTLVCFGCDGGSDERPSTGNEGSNTNSKSHPNLDRKGVSADDYEIKRESIDNEWHRGEVEDFFQDIAANERQEMAAARQSGANGNRTS